MPPVFQVICLARDAEVFCQRNLPIVDCHVTIVALNGSPPQLPSKDSHGELLQARSVKSRNVRANVSAGGKTAHPRKPRTFRTHKPRLRLRLHMHPVRPRHLQWLSVGSSCRWSRKHTPQDLKQSLGLFLKRIHPYSAPHGSWVSGASWCRAATPWTRTTKLKGFHQAHNFKHRWENLGTGSHLVPCTSWLV